MHCALQCAPYWNFKLLPPFLSSSLLLTCMILGLGKYSWFWLKTRILSENEASITSVWVERSIPSLLCFDNCNLVSNRRWVRLQIWLFRFTFLSPWLQTPGGSLQEFSGKARKSNSSIDKEYQDWTWRQPSPAPASYSTFSQGNLFFVTNLLLLEIAFIYYMVIANF